MRNSTEELQILYEISMSIGTEIDIKKMLKIALLAILKKLNCSAGIVLELDKSTTTKNSFIQIYSIPRNIEKNQTYKFAIKKDLFINKVDNYPLTIKDNSNNYIHLLELPGFGFLCLIKNRENLDEIFLKSLKPILAKLSKACQSCLKNDSLLESEGEYRSLVENINIGLYRNTGGAKGQFIRANPAMAKIFGYDSSEEFMKISVSKLYKNPAERKSFISAVLMNGFVKDKELLLRKKDGTCIWTSITAKIEYDEHKNIKWMDGVIEDISERKEAEAKLLKANNELEKRVKERTVELSNSNKKLTKVIDDFKKTQVQLHKNEEQYRTLVDNLNIGVYRNTAGPHGKYIQVNPALAKIFGYESTTEIMNIRVAELYQNPKERKNVIDEAFKHGFVKNKELNLRKKDGSPIVCLCSAQVQYDEKGNIKWFDGVMEDISERKEAERALKESEEQYRSLVDNLNVGIYRNTGDFRGQFLQANPAIAKMFGYRTVEEFMNISVAGLYQNANDRQAFLAEALKKGFVRNKELLLRKKDGASIVALCSAQVQFDKKGIIKWLDGVIEDITDRKKVEEELMKTQTQLEKRVESRTTEIMETNKQLQEEVFVRKKTENILEQRAAQLVLLNYIGSKIAAELDLEVLLIRITRLIHETFRYHHVSLFTVNKEKNELEIRAKAGIFADNFPPKFKLKMNQGMIGWVAAHGEKLLARDVKKEVQYYDSFHSKENTKSELSVPIRIGTEIVGVLDVQSPHIDAFDESDVTVMETLADQIAVAIENARLYKSLNIELLERKKTEEILKKRAAHLAILNEMGEKIVSFLDLDSILKSSVKLAKENFSYNNVMIFTKVKNKNQLVLKAISGDYENLFPVNHALNYGYGMIGWVGQNDKLLLANDITKELHFINSFGSQLETKSELSIPIRIGQEVVGVLDVQSPKLNAFDNNDIKVIETLASQVAIAIENARLYESIQKELEERVKAEKALVKSEAKFRSLVENSPHAILIINEKFELDYLNNQCCFLLGYSYNELINQDFREYLDESHKQLVADRYLLRQSSAKQKGIIAPPNKYEFTIIRKNGEQRFVELIASVIKGPMNKIKTVVQLQDITERKRMEIELKKSEERLRSFMDSATVNVFLLDAKLKVLEVNALVIKTYNWNKEAIIGESILNLLPDIEKAGRDKNYKEVIKTGVPFYSDEVTMPGIKDKYFALEAFKVGAGIGIISIDITRRKKMEQRLRDAMEIKSRFFSMVSHELRTPLTAIKEGLSIVLDGSAGKINLIQKDFLEMTKRNVDRLHRLINDVLDFSKLESGKIKFDMRKNNLESIINEVVLTHKSMAKEKKLYIKTNVPLNLGEIKFDSDRIIQVLTNLINNAFKFTTDGGLTLNVEKESKIVKICVKDTGIGIKKEDIAMLFYSFSQVGEGKNQKPGSTGLGLAICKEIINGHRGEIWVESEHGLGTKVIFTLPI
jgi:PAS domain S-box-containing protein